MDGRLVSFATVISPIRVVKQHLTAAKENGRPNRRNKAEFLIFSGVLWMGYGIIMLMSRNEVLSTLTLTKSKLGI